MSESAHDRRKRENAEYEQEELRRSAERSESELRRKSDALRQAQRDAESDRERFGEENEELLNELTEVREALSEATHNNGETATELLTQINRHNAFVDAVQAALPKLMHDQFSIGRDMIRTALARDGEKPIAIPLGQSLEGMVPVAGCGLKDGRVKLTPSDRGLVIRVDDEQNPEFWLEMVLSEQGLLRALANVHRLAHAKPETPPTP